jgi:hypothetical protein
MFYQTYGCLAEAVRVRITEEATRTVDEAVATGASILRAVDSTNEVPLRQRTSR